MRRRALVDFLVNRARSFIFSTAPVPAAAAAATAAIQFVQSTKARTANNFRLWQQLHRAIEIQIEIPSAIIPIIIGDENKAVDAAAKLREQDIFIPAIRYPTVARGKARLRVTLTASYSAGDVSTLIDALKQIEIVNRKSKIPMHPLAKLDQAHVWHPFTQMREWLKREPIMIVEGAGALLRDAHGREYLDANSSIWTNLHGHNHSKINSAIQRQLKKIAHSSALGLANEPASSLMKRKILVHESPIPKIEGPRNLPKMDQRFSSPTTAQRRWKSP